VFAPPTTKLSFFAFFTANDWTSTPFTFTDDVPQKPVPLTPTVFPAVADFALRDLMVGTGDGSTVKTGPSTVPPGVVT